MIRGEANARFQSRYRTAITIAGALAATVHLAGALAAPPYAPTPFQLSEPRIKGFETPEYRPVQPPAKLRRPVLDPVEGPVDTPDVELPKNFGKDLEPPPPPDPNPGDFIYWDEDPELVRSVQPEYPDIARQAEAVGKVVLLVEIDDTGRVVDARVTRSTAIGALEKAAIRAVRKWLFKPAMQRDRPVKCWVEIPFSFALR